MAKDLPLLLAFIFTYPQPGLSASVILLMKNPI